MSLSSMKINRIPTSPSVRSGSPNKISRIRTSPSVRSGSPASSIRSVDRMPLEKQRRLQKNKEKWTKILNGQSPLSNSATFDCNDDNVVENNNLRTCTSLPDRRFFHDDGNDIEKLSQILGNNEPEESDNTVSTVSSSSSEDPQDEVRTLASTTSRTRRPVNNIVQDNEEINLADRLKTYLLEKKGEDRRIELPRPAQVKKTESTEQNHFVVPLHKIRTKGRYDDDDSMNNSESDTMRYHKVPASKQPRRREKLDKHMEKRGKLDKHMEKNIDTYFRNLVLSDDDTSDGGDRMVSLRVKRLSNARQKVDEKMTELKQPSPKQRQQLTGKPLLSRRRMLDMEMSAPTTPIQTPLKQRSQPKVEECKSNSTSQQQTPKSILNKREHTLSSQPSVTDSMVTPVISETSPATEASRENYSQEREEEERRRKLLKQMFQNGLTPNYHSSTPKTPISYKADISEDGSFSEEETTLDDNDSGITITEILSNHSPTQVSPLTPYTPHLGYSISISNPKPVKNNHEIESTWLDDLFSNIAKS